MNLKDQIVSALGKQSADLTNVQIQEFSEEIAQRLGSQSDLSSLPEELYTREIIRLLPSIQIMVAQDSGSIQDAAQYAFQIVVQQVTDDPHSTIPEGYRSKEYCPYPGLSSFSEEDASYFFGRNKDIDAFLDTFDRRIITLTGPSGVGKSSFVSAGIFPHLRGKFGDTAVFLTFRVQTNISLLHDFSEFLSHETGEATETILQMLKQGENGLSTLLQSTLGEKYKRIFLFLDQFESLFVGDEKNREQDRVSLLDNLLFTERDQESELLTTIIASRENYFEHPAYTSRNRLVELIQRENFPSLL